MFKPLIALVLVALAAARFASSCPDPTDDQCRHANLPDGAFDRPDFRIPPADGLPLRSQWAIPAGGLCRRHGHDWPRYRHHRRWRPGMGRIGAHGRPNAGKTGRHLCGCERRRLALALALAPTSCSAGPTVRSPLQPLSVEGRLGSICLLEFQVSRFRSGAMRI